MAKMILPTRPDEARKLLRQLAAQQSDISQLAVTALNELPQK